MQPQIGERERGGPADDFDKHGKLTEDDRAARTIDTYNYAAGKLGKFIRGVHVGESTPSRIDEVLRSVRNAHGPTMARPAKTLLRGGLQLVVMASVLATNPVRDVSAIKSTSRPKGAAALTADELRGPLVNVVASEYCQRHDLVDPITVLIASGLRRRYMARGQVHSQVAALLDRAINDE